MPDAETWGPYTVPGRDTPVGNEEHLIFHCPVLRPTQQNLKRDMQELLTTFKTKYKGNNMLTTWASIPIETQITLALGSAPPATWGLSFLIAQKWLYNPPCHTLMSAGYTHCEYKTTPATESQVFRIKGTFPTLSFHRKRHKYSHR